MGPLWGHTHWCHRPPLISRALPRQDRWLPSLGIQLPLSSVSSGFNSQLYLSGPCGLWLGFLICKLGWWQTRVSPGEVPGQPLAPGHTACSALCVKSWYIRQPERAVCSTSGPGKCGQELSTGHGRLASSCGCFGSRSSHLRLGSLGERGWVGRSVGGSAGMGASAGLPHCRPRQGFQLCLHLQHLSSAT